MISRVIKLFISTGFWTIDRVRLRFGTRQGKRMPGTCVVLYYHAVTAEQRRPFARQMDELIRWARPVAATAKSALAPGVHHAAVTFDDGFQSVIDNALPELRQRGIPATIFVPSGYLGRLAEWSDGLRSGDAQTVMTANQLLSLPADLIAIGSHTISHPDLCLLDEDEARWELQESRRKLEKLLGQEVTTLSFPYGRYNRALVDWSRHAGYKRVFTISPALAYAQPGEYETGRVAVEPTDWRWEFRLKLLGAYRWLPGVYGLKSKMRHFIRNTTIGSLFFP